MDASFLTGLARGLADEIHTRRADTRKREDAELERRQALLNNLWEGVLRGDVEAEHYGQILKDQMAVGQALAGPRKRKGGVSGFVSGESDLSGPLGGILDELLSGNLPAFTPESEAMPEGPAAPARALPMAPPPQPPPPVDAALPAAPAAPTGGAGVDPEGLPTPFNPPRFVNALASPAAQTIANMPAPIAPPPRRSLLVDKAARGRRDAAAAAATEQAITSAKMNELLARIDADATLSPQQKQELRTKVQFGVAPTPKRTTFIANTTGADIVGQTDSFGKLITDADASKGYAVRENERGEREFVPLRPAVSATKPSYQTMAGPNGQPAVFAVYPDGRQPKLVGYKANRAQNVVFIDDEGNQRVVTIPAQFGGGEPMEVAGGGASAPTPAAQTSGVTAPTGLPAPPAKPGRVIGTARLPAAEAKAIDELQGLLSLVDSAEQTGERVQWGGVGGLGVGAAKDLFYRELGKGSPEEAELRNILNNIFSDIAKERGGSALTPAEITILKSYVPSPNTSVAQIKTNLAGIKRMLRGKVDAYQKQGGSPAGGNVIDAAAFMAGRPGGGDF